MKAVCGECLPGGRVASISLYPEVGQYIYIPSKKILIVFLNNSYTCKQSFFVKKNVNIEDVWAMSRYPIEIDRSLPESLFDFSSLAPSFPVENFNSHLNGH